MPSRRATAQPKQIESRLYRICEMYNTCSTANVRRYGHISQRYDGKTKCPKNERPKKKEKKKRKVSAKVVFGRFGRATKFSLFTKRVPCTPHVHLPSSMCARERQHSSIVHAIVVNRICRPSRITPVRKEATMRTCCEHSTFVRESFG